MDALRILVVLLFFSSSLILILWSEGITPGAIEAPPTTSRKEAYESAHFDDVFLSMFNSQKTSLNLFAKGLTEDNSKEEILLNFPEGKAGDGERAIYFSGEKGRVSFNEKIIKVYDSVKVDHVDSKSTADKLLVDQSTQKAHLIGNVHSIFTPPNSPRLEVNSKEAFLNAKKNMGEYQGDVVGKVQFENEKLHPRIKFKSNLLKMNLDDRLIRLKEKVYLERHFMKINALEGKIWLKNYQSGVKYFVLFDDVRLTEKLDLGNGEEILRKAFSEKIEGFPLERKLVLSGYPRVLQGRDVIKGNQVIIREEKEVVEILNTNSRFYLEDED